MWSAVSLLLGIELIRTAAIILPNLAAIAASKCSFSYFLERFRTHFHVYADSVLDAYGCFAQLKK
jgi:hypothetical protein